MKPFKIGVWNPEDEDFKILESFSSYDDADDRYDYWSDKYPEGWVEIIDPTYDQKAS